MEIEFVNVSKAFEDKLVLQSFSGKFLPGTTCIMGPSGVGKTTLLRLAAGLEAPDAGEVRGTDGLRFSFVFQEDRLLTHESVLTNVNFSLRQPSPQAAELLAAVGLGDELHTQASALSGGMARRVALVRALLVPFDVLILDEPFAGLDGDTKAQAVELIRACAAGKTVLCTTHDSADAAALGAGVLVLQS